MVIVEILLCVGGSRRGGGRDRGWKGTEEVGYMLMNWRDF